MTVRGPGRPPRPPPENPTRCALYERVSDEDQVTKGVSIPAQDEYLREWARKLGLEVTQVYEDDGRSGKSVDDRARFRQMVEDAAQRRWMFDVVLVYNTDRFARNADDALKYDKDLRDAKVQVRYGNLKDIDTRTPTGRFMFIIQAGQAEYFSADLATKVSLGMSKKGRMGYVVGRVSSRFFDTVDDPSRLRKNGLPSRRLVPKPDALEAERLRDAGFSYQDIARQVGADWKAVQRALRTLEKIQKG